MTLPGLLGGLEGDDGVGGESDLMISVCSRGINPGSIGVPPTTRIDDASVLRRSTGTFQVCVNDADEKILGNKSP